MREPMPSWVRPLRPPRHNAREAPARADGTRRRAAVRAVALLPLAVQFVVLLVRTGDRYQRFNLSIDFAIFHQAWHQIAQGNLSPDSTILGYPYWRAHFELVMWLLAPLHWIYNPGILLLWLQDAATVAAAILSVPPSSA